MVVLEAFFRMSEVPLTRGTFIRENAFSCQNLAMKSTTQMLKFYYQIV